MPALHRLAHYLRCFGSEPCALEDHSTSSMAIEGAATSPVCTSSSDKRYLSRDDGQGFVRCPGPGSDTDWHAVALATVERQQRVEAHTGDVTETLVRNPASLIFVGAAAQIGLAPPG
ncbi:hypothetical protein GQ53DRAFT_768960 [Thozetella sp. PMI_491]|nr:hypothetical protein GQ53DRAFT_768960 [Thozetella sp. PMI_491]